MNDKPVIIAALVVFVVLATFPMWYTLGSGDASPPNLEPPAGAMVFSAELSEQDVDLETLRDHFQEHQMSLSGEARLTEAAQGGKWRIADQQNRYLVLQSQENEGTVEIYNGCVHESDYMKANHMKLLIDWREAVVREADCSQVEINGEMYDRSLTRGCLRCHTNRQTFCARCHEYVNVVQMGPLQAFQDSQEPQQGIRCWNCHVDPKES